MHKSEVVEISEDGKMKLLIPKCDKCSRLMSGFFWNIYRQPQFQFETEAIKSIIFTDIRFECQFCKPRQVKTLDRFELDEFNTRPFSEIVLPPGIDLAKFRYTRIGEK